MATEIINVVATKSPGKITFSLDMAAKRRVQMLYKDSTPAISVVITFDPKDNIEKVYDRFRNQMAIQLLGVTQKDLEKLVVNFQV